MFSGEYSLFKRDGSSRLDASFDQIQLEQSPTIIFIGGLFHLAGKECGIGLSSLLSAIGGSETSVYFLEEKKETPWQTKVLDAARFNATGRANSEATAFAKTMLNGKHGNGDLRDSANSFSKITFLCYSHGTNLLCQIGNALQDRLRSMGAQDKEAQNILGSLVSINLGPTHQERMPNDGITRLIVAHRNDLMSKEIGQYDFPHANLRSLPITTCRDANTIVIVPEIGSPTEKAIIKRDTGRNTDLRFIEHEEAHSLYMYTNICGTRALEDRTLVTFSSLPTSQHIWDFCRLSLHAASLSIKDGTPRVGKDLIKNYDERFLSSPALIEQGCLFQQEEERFTKLAGSTRPVFNKSLWRGMPAAENASQSP